MIRSLDETLLYIKLCFLPENDYLKKKKTCKKFVFTFVAGRKLDRETEIKFIVKNFA